MGKRWLAGRIDAAIAAGFVLAGCSDRAIGDDGAAGSSSEDSTGASGMNDGSTMGTSVGTSAGTASAGDSSSTTGVDSDDDEAGDDDTPTFDVGVALDVAPLPPFDCDVPPPFELGGCEGSGEYDQMWICMAPSTEGDCLPSDDPSVVELLQDCAGNCGSLDSAACGPSSDLSGACCYWALGESAFCPGRPFVIDGHARLAAPVAGAAWQVPSTAASQLHDAALAAAWLHDARTEHAAIASFARFSLQLLALAAPPRFIAAAHQAALDELEHARLCFTLAARHGGTPSAPGPLDVRGALDASADPIAIVVATVREGCIAETISAAQLACACDAADDPWVRARLAAMLEQELAHVELAWSFVAWALAAGDPMLHAAVRAAFDEAERWIPCGSGIEPEACDRERWRRAGRLAEAERLAIAHQSIRHLVVPSAARLLARGGAAVTAYAKAPSTEPSPALG